MAYHHVASSPFKFFTQLENYVVSWCYYGITIFLLGQICIITANAHYTFILWSCEIFAFGETHMADGAQ